MKKVRTKATISYNMSQIKASGTVIENVMAKEFWKAGLRGYRKNYKKVIGKPDFVWNKYKVAVFCDSAFWHGYKNMTTKIHNFKKRKRFWHDKINRNIQRDKEVNQGLKSEGWSIIRLWDFQIEKNPEKCVRKVCQTLEKKYE
jgi:DNA mismatch endonuclease, patch repair protein